MRRILELYERHQSALHCLFLDWSKAFDTISHHSISNSLTRLGVPEPMVRAIMSLYSDPKFQVRDPANTSSRYPQHRGVRQGCPLSPYLFIIVLTCIMHDVDTDYEQKYGLLPSVFSAATPQRDIEYADDTVLLC